MPEGHQKSPLSEAFLLPSKVHFDCRFLVSAMGLSYHAFNKLSSVKSSGAAGGTCTRTVALTKATVYYMTFGGIRLPEQDY